jgi:hypothetical protein
MRISFPFCILCGALAFARFLTGHSARDPFLICESATNRVLAHYMERTRSRLIGMPLPTASRPKPRLPAGAFFDRWFSFLGELAAHVREDQRMHPARCCAIDCRNQSSTPQQLPPNDLFSAPQLRTHDPGSGQISRPGRLPLPPTHPVAQSHKHVIILADLFWRRCPEPTLLGALFVGGRNCTVCGVV